jgi:hypothetical protein
MIHTQMCTSAVQFQTDSTEKGPYYHADGSLARQEILRVLWSTVLHSCVHKSLSSNVLFVHWKGLLCSLPTWKLEYHPSSAVRDCFFNALVFIFHIWRASLFSYISWNVQCYGNKASKSKQSKAVPLHAMVALGGRGGIAPTHSWPRH